LSYQKGVLLDSLENLPYPVNEAATSSLLGLGVFVALKLDLDFITNGLLEDIMVLELLLPKKLLVERRRRPDHGHVNLHSLPLKGPALNKAKGLIDLGPSFQKFLHTRVLWLYCLFNAILENEVVILDFCLAQILCGTATLVKYRIGLIMNLVITTIVLQGGENSRTFNGKAQTCWNQNA
jgi:hypothetical protein